jgi:hypothetical protein
MTSLPPPPVVPPPTKFVTVTVNGTEALASFIDALQAARSDSKYTGGTYSAFLKLANGQTLQVEIALPLTPEASK